VRVILSAADARRHILAAQQAGLPAMLAGLEIHAAMALPPPRMWRRLPDYTNVPEEQLPALYVVAGSFAVQDIDDGEFAVDLEARLVAVVAGRSMEEAADRAAHFITAVRYVALADGALGGEASGITWQSESPAGGDVDDYYRAQADVTVTYRIHVPASLPPGLTPGNPQTYAIDEILIDLHHVVGPNTPLPTPTGDGP
jgi:hypothetical protein